MGGLEYWDTSFSFVDREPVKNEASIVAEMGGGTAIAEGSQPPGVFIRLGRTLPRGARVVFGAISDELQDQAE